MYLFSDRFFSDLSSLLQGPIHFRYVVQPILAVCLGLRDGRLDARAGLPPYFIDLLTNKGHRREIWQRGFKNIMTPFLIAIALDAIAQLLILKTLHPLSAIVTGAFLIALPYLIARGLANRISSARAQRHPT